MRSQPISKSHAGHERCSLHLLYHELSPFPGTCSYTLETGMFERQMDLFVQIRKDEGSNLRPVVTFDDGHSSDYEIALPILELRKLSAQFFVTVGWTGNKPGYMGWHELHCLQKSGHSIGAHGWSHTLLTHCTPAELNTELGRARMVLEDKLGISITTMSLPGGRYNRRVLAACLDAGYTKVYTSAPSVEQKTSRFTVGRLNIRADMTLEWITRLLYSGDRVLPALKRQYRIKSAAKILLGDRLYEELWMVANRKDSVRKTRD